MTRVALPVPVFVEPNAWRARAKCRQECEATGDYDLMFPTARPNSSLYPLEVEAAKAVCRRCPVLGECLEDVLAVSPAKDQHGIVAGMTPDEREKRRKARRDRALRERKAAAVA